MVMCFFALMPFSQTRARSIWLTNQGSRLLGIRQELALHLSERLLKEFFRQLHVLLNIRL